MQNVTKFVYVGDEYQIVNARIDASISDPYWCDTYNQGKGKGISWSIRFETDIVETELESEEDELLPPDVNFDGMQINVSNWHDLVGFQSQWREGINAETGECYGIIYVYDHQMICNGKVRITSRDGTKFHIIATGQNEEGAQFQINAPAEFTGIHVNGSENDTDESIRARLKQSVDVSNLQGTSFKLEFAYDSGIRAGRSFFRPTSD